MCVRACANAFARAVQSTLRSQALSARRQPTPCSARSSFHRGIFVSTSPLFGALGKGRVRKMTWLRSLPRLGNPVLLPASSSRACVRCARALSLSLSLFPRRRRPRVEMCTRSGGGVTSARASPPQQRSRRLRRRALGVVVWVVVSVVVTRPRFQPRPATSAASLHRHRAPFTLGFP